MVGRLEGIIRHANVLRLKFILIVMLPGEVPYIYILSL